MISSRAPTEFELIRRFFTRPVSGVALGIGDDAALLQLGPGQALAVSTDMLVSGTHFFPDVDPCRLGHKTLAVNLSDMAAMGAVPRWATLSLALPEVDAAWLQAFSAGLFALADVHTVALVGGDTTRGPLALNLTILGEVPVGAALRRDGARVGDDIWVSGTLGDAALALAHRLGRLTLDADAVTACMARLECPQPRVALGLALRPLAHAAIDLSDGLLADLGHILIASGVGAELDLVSLPCSSFMQSALAGAQSELARDCLLAGGDDYELCFTAPQAQRAGVAALAEPCGVALSRIGTVVAQAGCRVIGPEGYLAERKRGYEHF